MQLSPAAEAYINPQKVTPFHCPLSVRVARQGHNHLMDPRLAEEARHPNSNKSHMSPQY